MAAGVAGNALNVARDKTATQITTRDPASFAVDGNVSTSSSTNSTEEFPWWAVDLGREYSINHVIITLPNVGGDKRNYRRSRFFYS